MDSSEGLARKYQSSICTTSRVLSNVPLPLSIRSSITNSPANAEHQIGKTFTDQETAQLVSFLESLSGKFEAKKLQ